ncbi:MAG: J domain-containing protein [Bacteroidota bacterium]
MQLHYFKECKTLDEVKAKYKQLAMLHYPDRGGSKEIMQAINAEYEAIRKDPVFEFASQKEESKQDFVEFPVIIDQIIGFSGITIELCGSWLWLSGSTYLYKEDLKRMGFFWAREKKLWYWRPHTAKSSNHRPLTLDAIRAKYGSDMYRGTGQKELEERA